MLRLRSNRASAVLPSAPRLCHQPRSGNVSHQFRSFRPRLVTFTEQANPAYRPLRGRLPCAVKPIGPHRASEYALHPPGTAFGLLGVLLERLLGNLHRLPSHTTVPQPVFNRHQIDLRPLFGTAPLPTGISGASSRGEGYFWTVFGTATLPTGTPEPSPRGEEGLLTGLWHGHHAYKYLSGILAWRRWSSISARP